MDQETDHVKRIAELEAALATARQTALEEAAQMLLRLAHSARPMGLADAAKIVADLAKENP